MSFLVSLFLSPSIGDGPYSCPETAALHHSECKSNYALLLFISRVYPSVSECLSMSLFVCLYFCSGLCLCTRAISKRNVTPATSVSNRWLLSTVLTFSHLFPFLSFILSLVLNLISPSPIPSSDLCFLILLIHSEILLFSFAMSYCVPTKNHVSSF